MAILVFAPQKTRDVLAALEDWSPAEGIRFTLDRHEGDKLTFDVSGLDAREASDMAERHIRDTVGDVAFLKIMPEPAQ